MNIFITGGTSGIGLEVAKLYLKEGHRVGVCGRDISKFPDDVKSKFPNLELYKLDVTHRDEVLKIIGEFGDKGGIDLLVASAGRSVGKKTALPDFEAAYDVININVLGLMYCFEAALKHMVEQKSGHLVAIASVAGMVGLPGAGSYSASKAAVLKLCESFSIDLAPMGIDVSAIAPGFIDTPLTKKNDHSMPFLMSAEEGATRIKNAISMKKPLFVFPLPMKVLMYILERLPRFVYRKIMGKAQSKVLKKH